jgi:glycosyltransferase involved in cell wall biosynthesis
MRLAVLQRVCPSYRLALFQALSKADGVDFRLFIGDDLPNSKVRSASNLNSLKVSKLKTRFAKIGRRTLPWHLGLVDALRSFRPDVVLCEGESHFVGYLQALHYRARHSKNTALMHWCFTALPGESIHRRDVPALVKAYFRRHFDAFVSYSTFSKQCLTELGEPAEKIFVATNVGEVTKFLSLSDALVDTKAEARQKLELPDRFTVLYAGTLDDNKRPEVLLHVAQACDATRYNFVVIGSGPQLEPLKHQAARYQLKNVFLRGRVTSDLERYYRAADVLIVPGRGGIVMSEALASGVPVIVHEADGTESDLVDDGVTGLRLRHGAVQSFVKALEQLRVQPRLLQTMGIVGKQRLRNQYNEAAMARQIVEASRYAITARALRVQRAHS